MVATPEQLDVRVRLDVGKVNGIDAAFASRPSPDSKLFYDRNRAEGQGRNAAIICLAHRPGSVILAMLRTRQTGKPGHARTDLAEAA